MSQAPELLRCRGLQAGYGASQVLFGVDLTIRAGEVVGLLGRNGMGKSTTIKSLVGALKPRAGEAVLALHQVEAGEARQIDAVMEHQRRLEAAVGEKELVRKLRQAVAILTQHRNPVQGLDCS